MRKNVTKLLAVVLVLFGIFLFIYNDSTSTRELTVIQTVDVHGEILNKDNSLLKQTKFIKRLVDKNGGYKNCLLIDCGDLFQGTFEAALTKGEIVIPVFNSIKYDCFIPGNHDFDFGKQQFIKLISMLNCSVLAANLKIISKTCQILPWKIFEKNNLKIAVIGATNQNLQFWEWGKQFDGIHIMSIEGAIKKILPEVVKQKPDIIILAVHQGMYQAKRYLKGNDIIDIAYKFPQIDLILGGHSHMTINGRMLNRNVMFTQAGARGHEVAEIKIKIKDNKKIIISKIINTENYNPKRINSKFNSLINDLIIKKTTRLGKSELIENSSLFTARVMQQVTDSDIAFVSMRKDKLKFNLSDNFDVYKLLPYEDTIVKIDLTGRQLKSVLQEIQKYSKTDKYDNFYCLYRKDSNKNSECNLKTLSLDFIVPTKQYTLAVTSYDLASAGNRFKILGDIGLSETVPKLNTNIIIRDAVLKVMNR